MAYFMVQGDSSDIATLTNNVMREHPEARPWRIRTVTVMRDNALRRDALVIFETPDDASSVIGGADAPGAENLQN